MAGNPSLNDICKMLDLSKATVSKALNGYDSVSQETRERVLACARQLGYVRPERTAEPNARFTRVGVSSLMFAGNVESSSPYPAVLAGLMEELGQSHYDTVLIPPSVTVQQTVPYEEAMRGLNLDCAFINGLRLDDPYYR